MRILVIGPFGPGLLPESYARALERNGHEVFRFDSDRAYFGSTWYAGNRMARGLFKHALWNRLNMLTVEIVRCVRPSLVLACKAVFLAPETVRRIRLEEATLIVNYYPDDPYIGVPLDPRKTSAQRRNLIDALKEYTRVFTYEKGLVRRLEADGVAAAYLPFGVDPDSFRPAEPKSCPECGKMHHVAFVGQHNVRRERQLDAVERHEVALWGARWKRARKRFRGRHLIHEQKVYGPTCASVYSSANVCLNILNEWNIPGHNMRTFEVPASGGVMLSTHTAEQAEFFPEGEAAWYYRDPSELDGILDRLVHEPETLERTRRTALKIVRDHSYQSRAKELLRMCSIEDRG